MAELATQLEFTTPSNGYAGEETLGHRLKVVDQAMIDAKALAVFAVESQTATTSEWFAADRLPSIFAARESCDEESQQLLAERQALLNAGEFSEVPYAFNVLTTAHKLLTAEHTEGKGSARYKQLYQGFYLDAKRHRDEARRRLTWEYFPEVEQAFDPAADSYVYGGYVLKEVVDNGLSPVGSENVGIDVLVANRREEYTSTAIGKLGKLMLEHAGVELAETQPTMITVSQIDASPQTMIWALRFDAKNNRRFQEQVGFTKDYITHEVIVEALKLKGVIAPDAAPSQKELLGVQSINLSGEGVLAFVKTLDEIASQKSGKNIFMGEAVPSTHYKDYEAIPAEADRRQAENQDEIESLMREVLRLAQAGTDGWLANRLVDDFVTNMLLDKVVDDPRAALYIFGEQTAHAIELSMRLREQGDALAAERLIISARAEAPLATVCTGGSCGLEGVDTHSAEGQELAKKLKANSGDSIVKDKERTCKCGKKTVVYAYNANKVNKYCTSCHSFESKASKAPAQKAGV